MNGTFTAVPVNLPSANFSGRISVTLRNRPLKVHVFERSENVPYGNSSRALPLLQPFAIRNTCKKGEHMSKTVTITEALADLKVIQKRIANKQGFIGDHIARAEQMRDPLAKDGGSPAVIEREMQALHDLREDAVSIRRAIKQANAVTEVTIGSTTRTIADWLVWRRDVAPVEQSFLTGLVKFVERARQQATQRGGALVSATANTADTKPTDIIVNVSEVELSKNVEELNALLELLDGQLSLKNATVMVTY